MQSLSEIDYRLLERWSFLDSNLHSNLDTILLSQATNDVVSRVPKATQSEMQEAVDAAKEAYKTWSQTTVMARQQYMLKYQQLIKDNMVTSY